jgi:RNA polymerase sigma-70 factor (ECF subfamily)
MGGGESRVPRSKPIVESVAADVETIDIATLFRLHARTVHRWAARLGGPGVDAEDVVQEVFLIARRRLKRFTGDAKVTTWLFRATERVVLGLRRKQRWRRWLASSPDSLVPHLVSARPTAVDEIERQQSALFVYRVLDRMRHKYRQVLILFELEELSTEEIARLMGTKATTVRVWLFRARAEFVAQKDKIERGGAGAEGGK